MTGIVSFWMMMMYTYWLFRIVNECCFPLDSKFGLDPPRWWMKNRRYVPALSAADCWCQLFKQSRIYEAKWNGQTLGSLRLAFSRGLHCCSPQTFMYAAYMYVYTGYSSTLVAKGLCCDSSSFSLQHLWQHHIFRPSQIFGCVQQWQMRWCRPLDNGTCDRHHRW